MAEQTCLRTKELAVRLGVSERTLEKWRMTPGAGPPFSKLGAAVVYQVADVNHWLDENSHTQTTKGK